MDGRPRLLRQPTHWIWKLPVIDCRLVESRNAPADQLRLLLLHSVPSVYLQPTVKHYEMFGSFIKCMCLMESPTDPNESVFLVILWREVSKTIISQNVLVGRERERERERGERERESSQFAWKAFRAWAWCRVTSHSLDSHRHSGVLAYLSPVIRIWLW